MGIDRNNLLIDSTCLEKSREMALTLSHEQILLHHDEPSITAKPNIYQTSVTPFNSSNSKPKADLSLCQRIVSSDLYKMEGKNANDDLMYMSTAVFVNNYDGPNETANTINRERNGTVENSIVDYHADEEKYDVLETNQTLLDLPY